MRTVVDLGLLVVGLALVVGGAETLFKGLLAAAGRFGISAFVLTVVLSGFELENLAAGIAANVKGLPGAAAGTFLGATTFLALGVAGLGALISPFRTRPPAALLAWTAAAPLPLLVLSLDGRLSRLDGAVLMGWFAVALVGVARSHSGTVEERTGRSGHPLARVAAGLVLVGVGGDLLGEGIRRVVSRFGLSQTLLGNTALAAAVEAEELGRVVVPARRGRSDLAVANIAGTLVHFTSFNAAVIALVRPLALDHATLVLHLPVAVGATVLMCLALAVGRGLGRAGGAALATLYVAYVVVAVLTG